jgi:hypothetical protein
MKLSAEARALLLSIRDTRDGVRYQACDGKERRAAAHELEGAGLAEWKGNSFGSHFYCITPAGLTELSAHSGGAAA